MGRRCGDNVKMSGAAARTGREIRKKEKKLLKK